jgi:hypothetical protein
MLKYQFTVRKSPTVGAGGPSGGASASGGAAGQSGTAGQSGKNGIMIIRYKIFK